jgi:DNA-directed RNA polymerase subunit M/transcription elongation factor TFIIS
MPRPDKLPSKPVCKECGTLLLTNFEDLDRQIYVWCRRCGLIRDSKYTMGKSIKSLMRYTKKRNIEVDDQRMITAAYNAYGLRNARIVTARILNGEKFQSKPTPEPDGWDEI